MLNVNKATDQVDSRAKPCYGKPVSVQKLVVSGRIDTYYIDQNALDTPGGLGHSLWRKI